MDCTTTFAAVSSGCGGKQTNACNSLKLNVSESFSFARKLKSLLCRRRLQIDRCNNHRRSRSLPECECCRSAEWKTCLPLQLRVSVNRPRVCNQQKLHLERLEAATVCHSRREMGWQTELNSPGNSFRSHWESFLKGNIYWCIRRCCWHTDRQRKARSGSLRLRTPFHSSSQMYLTAKYVISKQLTVWTSYDLPPCRDLFLRWLVGRHLKQDIWNRIERWFLILFELAWCVFLGLITSLKGRRLFTHLKLVVVIALKTIFENVKSTVQ